MNQDETCSGFVSPIDVKTLFSQTDPKVQKLLVLYEHVFAELKSLPFEGTLDHQMQFLSMNIDSKSLEVVNI